MRCCNCDHCNLDEDDVNYGKCFINRWMGIPANPYEKIECDDFEVRK